MFKIICNNCNYEFGDGEMVTTGFETVLELTDDSAVNATVKLTGFAAGADDDDGIELTESPMNSVHICRTCFADLLNNAIRKELKLHNR